MVTRTDISYDITPIRISLSSLGQGDVKDYQKNVPHRNVGDRFLKIIDLVVNLN